MTMLTTYARRLSAIAVITLWLAACGGGLEVLVIPLFEFGFKSLTSAGQVGFFPFPQIPTQSSGKFDSVNFTVDSASFPYIGDYSGCTFSIKLDPSAAAVVMPANIAVSYNGRFVSNDSIELKPTSGINLPTLTLARQGTGSRNMGC
jgi:hypothetical protein